MEMIIMRLKFTILNGRVIPWWSSNKEHAVIQHVVLVLPDNLVLQANPDLAVCLALGLFQISWSYQTSWSWNFGVSLIFGTMFLKVFPGYLRIVRVIGIPRMVNPWPMSCSKWGRLLAYVTRPHERRISVACGEKKNLCEVKNVSSLHMSGNDWLSWCK